MTILPDDTSHHDPENANLLNEPDELAINNVCPPRSKVLLSKRKLNERLTFRFRQRTIAEQQIYGL